ncbi:hypothetical protein GA0070216_103125 [Micromonospora matsumotoense]|uniref:Excreted virulence factor EspC, type VII ESX diderm n=1 Tax=Micromonospora matsumotoense TaxID=121616 RepID=A0A1C4W6Z9_9ACTN|nr:hypothetical protein [Micromonospora matsumotoense]SCE91869.1 hypothetical protein GA0070216_103125 [Micromonospora matsumotoense]
MSSFVEIRTSVADILGIANRLRFAGQSMSTTMDGKLQAITALEAAPGTLPPDEFTVEFLKTYHKSVEVSGGGQQMNEAVKTTVPKLGEAMDKLGAYVADAMWSYTGTDDDNATDIDRAGGRH